MQDTAASETINYLQRTLGLQADAQMGEEGIIKLLAAWAANALQKGEGTFYQMMYRLDIPEAALHAALQEADAPTGVARLVYRRQIEKYLSRKAHRTKGSAPEDQELMW